MSVKKSSQDLTSAQLFSDFLTQVNNRFNYSSETPDIERLNKALRAIDRGEVLETHTEPCGEINEGLLAALGRIEEAKATEKNNSFIGPVQKSIDNRGAGDSIYTPPTKQDNFSDDQFDYRKSPTPVYAKSNKPDAEKVVKRMNELLAENELNGLDTKEEQELKNLLKKVR